MNHLTTVAGKVVERSPMNQMWKLSRNMRVSRKLAVRMGEGWSKVLIQTSEEKRY